MAPSFKEHDGLFAVVDCTDWDDFRVQAPAVLRWASGSDTLFDRYIFRGQSCSSWGLAPSFDRKHEDLSYRELEEYYGKVMQAFTHNYDVYGRMDSAALELFREATVPNSPRSYETLAQHYGLQTRLMDWSRSIYVSAFFAFSRLEQCSSDLVSVWALDRVAVQEAFSDDHIEIIDELYQGNRRQLWQLGVLLKNRTERRNMASLFKSGSGYYNERLTARAPFLFRFDLPREEIRKATDDLNMMRINSVTLFPGIEGVVQWIERGGVVTG
ncbi:MAG: FRG domain-containing protein [Sphingomonadales bacterium]|nr:MAG: FRG domain-containing protein [Sphingomonadales bacterium]